MIQPQNQTPPVPRTRHRAIRERWVIEGTLILDTPAHFGGESDAPVDMALLRDETDGRPLLPGSSIAGALRSHLRAMERGDGVPFPKRPERGPMVAGGSDAEIERERGLLTTTLFGAYRGDDDGIQSPLVVEDAFVDPETWDKSGKLELRDGVAIDGRTRTAAEDKKFDMEVLSAGTRFALRFELAAGEIAGPALADSANSSQPVPPDVETYRQRLLRALATVLDGLSKGEVWLGARTRRGFGRCHVEQWTVRHFDLRNKDHLLAWLALDRDSDGHAWCAPVERREGKNVAELLSVETLLDDAREMVRLRATFAVDSSLLIRSGLGVAADAPDTVHLQSYRPNNGGEGPELVPIVPGSTWAGVLRHRAIRICRTLAGEGNERRVTRFVDGLFGPSEIGRKSTPWASRLWVGESVVEGGRRDLIQTRIAIDRFTGGAAEGRLFEEQPVFGAGGPDVTGADGARVDLDIRLSPPPPKSSGEEPGSVPAAEVGLLLLLLKDIWTGDLRIGGEASIGRGRLRGLEARFEAGASDWKIADSDTGLDVDGDADRLEDYVHAFYREMTGHD